MTKLKAFAGNKLNIARMLISPFDRVESTVNSLPNDKILDMTKLKAFADNKLNIAKMMISPFDKSRKHCG